MKRVWLLVLCSILMIVAGAGLVSAQAEAPLVISLNGDLWSWNGDPAQPPYALTSWGYNDPAVLSPDGTRIAYNSVAQLVVEAMGRVGGIGGGALPSNIWVINLGSGDGVRVADQPADASFFTEGVADRGIIRSDPAWSPEGGRLVWTEETYPERINSIVLHDFAAGPRVIAGNLPPSAGVPAPKEVRWGQSGILVRDTQVSGDGSLATSFSLFSPDGALFNSFQVGDGLRTPVFYDFMQAGDREMIGVLFNDGVWMLYDPFSGAEEVAAGIPEMYSLRNPSGSLALSPIINDIGGFTWRAFDPAGVTVAEFVSAPYFVPQRYAISPSVQAIAYSDYLEDQRIFSDSINVWQAGTITVIPSAVGFPLIG
ncbi:MAG: PD40 domain-containing protein, partial [Anaerolineae bacterium]|nr:PD40 domain-containing protein [Anaerolineae bacterium]